MHIKMPIEKRPLSPVLMNLIPPYYKQYKVQNGDSWDTVAKQHGMEVWELIYQNFRTCDAAEINWYLHHYVGCKKVTADFNNWMFSSDANPGIIYVPVEHIIVPPEYNSRNTPKPSNLTNVWAGFGKSHSGDLAIVGAHDMTGMIYNLGDELPDVRNAVININGYKLGIGLGASIGAVFIIAHGYKNVDEMVGVTGGKDFDAAIGAKLGDFLKGIKGVGKAVDTIQKYKKIRYLTENAIKNMHINEKGVYTIPIPFAGVGLHGWLGFKFGNITIFRKGKGVI